MEKLSPEEIIILKEASEGYTTPDFHRMSKAAKIKEKFKEDDPEFSNSEMAQMFEFIASYASVKHPKLITDSLRERLRRFKFPPDGIER